jgi:excinuclease ABC subunit C
VEALAQIQAELELPDPPNRIECYDISSLQGVSAAGSMVVFEQGVPNKRLYRKFTIKTVQGQDDFAAMEELLSRRFRRWEIAQEEAQKPGGKLDPAFGILPNLLLVDGGKGQRNRAAKVLERYHLADRVPVAGLAKKHEDIYLLDREKPIRLPSRSQALFLIQRVRDEAHRFALKLHKTQRRKKGLTSRLDGVSGIGPARRQALLEVFGDLDGVRKAPIEELIKIRGVTRSIAERIKAVL